MEKSYEDANCRRKRILLAEDNIPIQKITLKILSKLGHHADAVSDGQAVLDALESIDYDLVLMDCQIPILDGFETVRRIRSACAKVIDPDIPIIALTANTMTGEREKCLAAGMNDYVTKPVDPFELARVLIRWLRKPQYADSKREGDLETQREGTMPEFRSLQVLDREELLDRLMGDEDLAREVIGAFIIEMPEKLTQIRGIIERGVASELQKQAHTLRGTCGTIGAMAMCETAARLEDAARSGDMDRAALLVEEMKKGLNLLRADVDIKENWKNGRQKEEKHNTQAP